MKKIQRQSKLSVIQPPRCGTNRGSQNHGHAVNRERHAALLRRKRVGEDRLLARLEPAAADSLKYPEEDQRAETGSKSAQERADGKKRHARHIEALAAHHRRKPTAHRQDDGVRDEVGSENPGAFVGAGRKAPGDVREGDVGDAGVQHFHERRERDRQRDDPRIDGLAATSAWAGMEFPELNRDSL